LRNDEKAIANEGRKGGGGDEEGESKVPARATEAKRDSATSATITLAMRSLEGKVRGMLRRVRRHRDRRNVELSEWGGGFELWHHPLDCR